MESSSSKSDAGASASFTSLPLNVTPSASRTLPINITVPNDINLHRDNSYSISGKVFDPNRNENVDANDNGLSGWLINLEQPAGIVIANATSNGAGDYAFSGLNPGIYVIYEVLPTGWAAVMPADGKYTVNLTDSDLTGLNFANKEIST